jgi:DNA-binding transcriptional MerR regulator
MRPGLWRVGELAKRTGVSVRTLHWYEEMGLLSPAQRSESGQRLYSSEDLGRLQQIRSLRQIGLSLDEIRDCLGKPEFSPSRVIALHLARLDEEIDLQQRLRSRLQSLARRYEAAEAVSAEEFIQTIEVMTMLESYFTTEQLEELRQRREQLGDEQFNAAGQEWPELIGKVRSAMAAGENPASAPVQALAKRWMELVQSFSGGNRGIEQSVMTMYKTEPGAMERFGLDADVFAYVQKALAAAK